jgi:enoyl-CoA hydratase
VVIDLEARGPVAVITVNQPDKLNALNVERLGGLKARLDEASGGSDVRAIVLTGAGDRAFIAGADIKAMAGFDRDQALAFGELGHAVARTIEAAPQPVIAAVNGFAFGGGCELALACDIRLASDTAVFAQPEVGLGIPPGWGGTQRLPRVVGPGLAAELIYTGRRVDATEALRIGLVNAVYPSAELMERAIELAELIGEQSATAVAASKRLIAQTRGQSWADDLAAEARSFADAFRSDDQREGMTAFVEKRKPSYSGTRNA